MKHQGTVEGAGDCGDVVGAKTGAAIGVTNDGANADGADSGGQISPQVNV